MSLNRIIKDAMMCLFPYPVASGQYHIKNVLSEGKFIQHNWTGKFEYTERFQPEYFRYALQWMGKEYYYPDRYLYVLEGYARRSFVFSGNENCVTKYEKKRGKFVVTQGK